MVLKWSKLALFLVCLVPAAWIGYEIWLSVSGQPNALGPDPGKDIVHFNGQWALRLLLVTLLVTPLRQVTGWVQVVRYRRMLGLFAFFYATLHLSSYLVFLLGLRWDELAHDIAKKPYILVGFAAFCLMVPMAITSNRWMMRKLKQRWKQLHRLIYLVVILALVHLFWLTRSSYFEVFVYASIAAMLLGYRIYKSPRLGKFLRRRGDAIHAGGSTEEQVRT